MLLRNLTYRMFVDLGRAPSIEESSREAGLTTDEMGSVWRRLHDAHALVLHPGTTEIRMANPFAAQPTPYRVTTGERSWFANCAWDAFGICAALQVDGRIETRCSDCGEEIIVNIVNRKPDSETLLFHCLVPARQWWDDIVFT